MKANSVLGVFLSAKEKKMLKANSLSTLIFFDLSHSAGFLIK